MGKVESKTKISSNENNTNHFQLLMKKRFREIANEKSTIDKSAFLITEERFVQFANMMLGDVYHQATALLQLHQPIKQITEALVSSFFKCENLDISSTTLLVDFFMEDIPPQLDAYSLSCFMQRKIAFLIIIKHINELLFFNQKHKLLPEVGKNSLLTPAALCLICANLPEDSRAQWKLLFSSEKDGESFTKLMKSVDGAGPCLIIIETVSSHIFGAFASQGLIRGPSYTGDTRCFLFQDRQKLQLYNATGYNNNFAYLNSQQASLPNGIGMGGSDANWSFFLREDFSSGISTPGICTFEKCWPAEEAIFIPKNVEIWRIGENRLESKEDVEIEDIAQRRSSTNKREMRAILEMSGREFRGDTFRKQESS